MLAAIYFENIKPTGGHLYMPNKNMTNWNERKNRAFKIKYEKWINR